MTVIAFDLNKLVTDGRTTMGDNICSDSSTKIKAFDHAELGEVVGAFCGAVMLVEPWINHMAEHGFKEFPIPDDYKENGASGIIITEEGVAIEIDIAGLWHRIERPTAYGSGCIIAQHYLMKGESAVTAVRETIKSVPSCGGRILEYDLQTKRFRSYAR